MSSNTNGFPLEEFEQLTRRTGFRRLSPLERPGHYNRRVIVVTEADGAAYESLPRKIDESLFQDVTDLLTGRTVRLRRTMTQFLDTDFEVVGDAPEGYLAPQEALDAAANML